MAKFRARTKTGKNRQRWKKGQSSSSNPSKTKHRDAAKARIIKGGFSMASKEESETPRGFGDGPARLTAESLLRHDALMGNAGGAEGHQTDDAATLGQTNKTFDTFAGSSIWSECSNVSFGRMLPRFNPNNARHKEMLAILSAIGEVIAESRRQAGDADGDGVEEASGSEYFGALLSSLDSLDGADSLSATVGLLSVVIKTVPAGLLAAKFAVSSKLLLELLARHGQSEDSSAVRGIIGCLSVLLRAIDRPAWANSSTLRILDSILAFVTDPRPKVRKASHYAVCVIFTEKADDGDRTHPAAGHVAKALSKLIEANAGRDMKAVMHVLILLRDAMAFFPKQNVKESCEAVLQVMTLGTGYTLSCGFQALHGLFSARPPARSLPADLNAKLVAALYDFQPSLNDGQPMIAWLTVQQEAHINLAEQDPALCIDNLPQFFARATKCWASDKREVAVAATTALKAILNEAVRPHMDMFADDKALSQFKAIFGSIEDGLKYQYHGAWAQVLNLLTTFLDVCSKEYGKLTGGCLRSLADLRASVNFSLTNELDYVVGKAVRTMGPEAVLSHVPLQITGAETDYEFPRSWLLPVLRENVQNASLAYFRSHFLPLAASCQGRSQRAASEGDKIGQKTYEVLVVQIWSLLPGFCNNPTDLAESFKGVARVMGEHLQNRKDLRSYILASLRQLILKCSSNEGRQELGRFAKNYLPILFNLYTTAPVGAEETGLRLSVLETVKLYLGLADAALVHGMFDKALQRFEDSSTDAFLKEACHDLLRVMLPFADEERLMLIFTMSAAALDAKDHKRQKKAYKMLEELSSAKSGPCKAFLVANSGRIQSVLLESLSKASPPSQAARLKCLTHIVQQADCIGDDDFLYKIIPETVLCVKATNEKARANSYTLLVVIGEALQRLRSAASMDTIIKDYMKVVLAGLAGGPTMVHCTLLAITRIFYEFHDIFPAELVEMLVGNVCLLLTSQSREVVGSSVSFLHVFVTAHPVTESAQFCEKIVRSLCRMTEDCKRHFRLKTRYLFDRLVRRFGYDVVKSIIPKDDVTTLKRLKNIKKIQARKSKSAASADEPDSDDDEADENGATFKIRARAGTMGEILAENAGDEPNDGEDDDDNNDAADKKAERRTRRKKGQAASYIAGEAGGDDIVDFLDASAAQKVTSARPDERGEAAPVERAKRGWGGFEIAPDGRIIIEDEASDDEKRPAGYVLDNSDDEADDANNFRSLVSTAGKRKRAPGGSVASSKKSAAEPASKYRAGGTGIHRPLREQQKDFGAAEYRSAKAKGDVKRKGKPDPYAYVPLQKSSMNRRKKAKFAGQFKGLVKAAETGSAKGKKANALSKKMKRMKV